VPQDACHTQSKLWDSSYQLKALNLTMTDWLLILVVENFCEFKLKWYQDATRKNRLNFLGIIVLIVASFFDNEKKMREEGKLLTKEFQLTNIEEIRKIESHH
jgi:hypothetical protein